MTLLVTPRALSGHTPTPWTVEDVVGDGNMDICGPDVPGEGSPNLIATALGDTDEARANAEFIVRAVNSHQALVDELKRCQDLLFGLLDYFEPGHELTEIQRQRERISAALALAEGSRP